ncbi:PAS domain-containing protein [Aureimonas fodinaquatilis]|uniref:histidine kinase n=1 Tax=Aureimonas fodinaquatilis TaxID=2565783 RepID=A0A5B0E4H8_9HYPH|nr:PAS domain-containing sensor histidine kinase [Aureimonas fodinaquatilis]KAA0972329.1 PAS domain-containing protein [Aureimonas fodinaquatilis]
MVAYKALRALANTEMALFAQDEGLRYLWIFNGEGSWLELAANGKRDEDFLAPEKAQQCTELKRKVLATGEPDRFELQIMCGEVTRWFDIRLDADRDESGAIIGIIGASLEITEQKQREATLKTLLRELSHRSKNLLAIIQSLASQTARHSITVPEFLVRFRGRIQSLASSQDIVTDTDWRGAGLADLITLQVERYAPDGMRQVLVSGPDVYLSPTAALHVGLALHELAVNAASYGALTAQIGIVEIQTKFTEQEGQRCLSLTWHEKNGPHVDQDRNTRFGTSTLERIVPNSVSGSAELSYRHDGLHYHLMIPDTQFHMMQDKVAATQV